MSYRALTSILKITCLLSIVSSKLESAIVIERCRASLCCLIVLSKHMIGYWFFVKGCRLDRILSSQRPGLPSITSLSRFFFLLLFLPRERLVASPRRMMSCFNDRKPGTTVFLCNLHSNNKILNGKLDEQNKYSNDKTLRENVRTTSTPGMAYFCCFHGCFNPSGCD